MDLIGEAYPVESRDCLLLDVQERCDLRSFATIESEGLKRDRVTDLSTDELSLLSLILGEARQDKSLLGFDTASLGLSVLELDHTPVYYVVVSDRVSFDLLTGVVEHALDLLVLHLLGSDDAVVGELVLLLQLRFDLGSESYVIGELEVFGRSEVVFLLILYRDGAAEDLELLLVDVAEESVDDNTIDLVDLGGGTELLLDQSQRSVSLTEAWDRSVLLVVLQCLIYLGLVVCCAHRYGDDSCYFGGLLNRYSHSSFYYLMYTML